MFRKLDCVCVHTDDLLKSLSFYTEMGLREAWRLERTTEQGIPWSLVGLDFPETGGSQLVISTDPDRRPTEIEILVDDVRHVYEALQANIEIDWVVAPFPIENGHVAVMTAPDGNTFVLIGK